MNNIRSIAIPNVPKLHDLFQELTGKLVKLQIHRMIQNKNDRGLQISKYSTRQLQLYSNDSTYIGKIRKA